MDPEPLSLAPDAGLPDGLLRELTALYASNRDVHALSGDFPAPDALTSGQVAAALTDERAVTGSTVLLGRSEGRLVGLAITLDHHRDPADPDRGSACC